MTSIRVKFAFVDTSVQLSEKSLRRFRIEYTSAIVVCALLIPYTMYLNHFGLGFDLIFSTGFLIQMVIQAFAISHKTLDFSDNPVVNISYLPIIYFGLLIVLSLLVFYNLYSRYAIP